LNFTWILMSSNAGTALLSVITGFLSPENHNRYDVERRLPVSGSRRVFWRDGRQDTVCRLLDELQAFQEQLRVSSVKADIVRGMLSST
jgi:hypothetical protein